MEHSFKTCFTSRRIYLDFLEKYSLEQLNTIPKGFSNNIIWNTGHIIVAQQALIYKTAELPMYVSDELYNTYRPGSVPTQKTTEAELNTLKDLLLTLPEKTYEDYLQDKFRVFHDRMTGTGFYLESLADALNFNNYHEGIHLGYIMNIRKFV